MTDWPDFSPFLLPGLSASPIRAELPPGTPTGTPSPDATGHVGGWAGLWRGWGGRDAAVDLVLAIDTPAGSGATVTWAAAGDGIDRTAETLDARFDGDELVAERTSGTGIRWRLRDADTLEFLHGSMQGRWMCGVLARWHPDIEHAEVRVPTRLRENGRPVALRAFLYRPPGPGPFPTLLFNHGSTGTGSDPSMFARAWACLPLARHFVARGWMVAFPQRRGRGGSDGTYGEGLAPDGSGYSCDPAVARAGVERALEDIDEAVRWLVRRDDVDRTRMLIGGQSRGGALAIAYAGSRSRSPFRGAIEFVGGWLGDALPNASLVNTEVFERGGPFDGPTSWLHSERDPYYFLAHSRTCFDAFVAAGGRGDFHAVETPNDRDGHQIVFVPSAWEKTMERFLENAVGARHER